MVNFQSYKNFLIKHQPHEENNLSNNINNSPNIALLIIHLEIQTHVYSYIYVYTESSRAFQRRHKNFRLTFYQIRTESSARWPPGAMFNKTADLIIIHTLLVWRKCFKGPLIKRPTSSLILYLQ